MNIVGKKIVFPLGLREKEIYIRLRRERRKASHGMVMYYIMCIVCYISNAIHMHVENSFSTKSVLMFSRSVTINFSGSFCLNRDTNTCYGVVSKIFCFFNVFGIVVTRLQRKHHTFVSSSIKNITVLVDVDRKRGTARRTRVVSEPRKLYSMISPCTLYIYIYIYSILKYVLDLDF